MAFINSERLEERRIGQKKIQDLKENRNKTLIIHYSCESFFNTHGRTPRITSIAIKNRDNGTSIVFSIHLMAQLKQKDLSNLSDNDFDFLEKEMLKEFYDFVGKHKTYKWVHWNMRNASFGFEAIANRYRILGGNSRYIEDQFKYDLPQIIGNIYTYKFEEHNKPSKGQLLNLAIRNKITIRDTLTGKEESAAFDERNFLNLHMSTMRKVEVIDRILNLEEKHKLRVAVSIFKSCGLSIPGIIEIVRNNWFLFLLWSVLMAVVGISIEPIIQHLVGTDTFGN